MIGENIEIAAKNLSEGKLVSNPTETVYGLAGNALNDSAVANIFKVKNRPFFDPLILHVKSVNVAKLYTQNWNETALKLAENFMPGPLTLLMYKNEKISDLITSGSPKVAIRIPFHEMTLKLLEIIDFPLVAPSANPFQYISPTKAEHVEIQLGDKISYILDGGECKVGIESTIIDVTEDKVKVMRLGGLDLNEIEKCIGYKPLIVKNDKSVPGQLEKHYSPHKKLKIIQSENEIEANHFSKIGVLSFGDNFKKDYFLNLNLSSNGNIDEAAQHLFSYLRQLDQSGLEIIYTKLLPENGLGMAINDRLTRAATKV